MTPTDPITVAEESDAKGLAGILEQVSEDIPADFLKRFLNMFVLRNMLLQLEVHREAETRGENDRVIVDLKDRLKSNRDATRALETESELWEIRVPKTGSDEVLIHGRVTDETDRGVESVVVTMSDGQGASLGIEHVEVGPTGYFSFAVDKKTAGRLTAEGKEGVRLTVTSTEGQVLYKTPTPVKLEKETELRTDIRIPSAGPGLVESVVRPARPDAATAESKAKSTREPTAKRKLRRGVNP